MKSIIVIVTFLVFGCISTTLSIGQTENSSVKEKIKGKWVRVGVTGPIAIVFKEDEKVEVDFGNDGKVDVLSKYKLFGDTISFIDEEGAMCHESGEYRILYHDYYISFDLIKDNCGGRIKSTMGYWTKPEFNDFISDLGTKISTQSNPELFLTRARIYLATGNSPKAQADLDKYIEQNDTDPRAYLNRAATKMPHDFGGVVADCNRSINLDPENKNSYFLRGLARYELGEEEEACADFERAIELGFSVLRIAEQQKCAAYWADEE